MSTQTPDNKPRWWRRGQDLALSRAREARDAAADAFYDLDLIHKDLPVLVRAHREGLAAQQTRQGQPSDALLQDWERVAHDCDTALANFLDFDATFSRERDYEEVEARNFATAFEQQANSLRSQIRPVTQFRDRHNNVLQGAYNLTLAAPRVVAEAEMTVKAAASAIEALRSQGLHDEALVRMVTAGAEKLKAAQAALAQREWGVAVREASSAKSAVAGAADRAALVPAEADRIRSSLLSVKTRREGLHTQRERLEPVMSDLRRRYTLGSWKHLDDAPQRAQQALVGVEDGIVELEGLVAQSPLDVAKAAGVLRKVRENASGVEQILRAARDTRDRLDEVSADPELLLTEVRRKTVDARRFLNNLGPERSRRFNSTLDSFGARTEALLAAAGKNHPDWGALVAEADSIVVGLDAMIRTARSD